jgi:hypothetical protein
MNASLSRRLSAFFRSTPGQDPKAAKFAVLIPGHTGFPNRAKQSEGSNSTPSETPPVSACKPLCAILLAKASVPAFARESERGPFVREVEKRDEKRLGIKFMAAALPTFSLLPIGGATENREMYVYKSVAD